MGFANDNNGVQYNVIRVDYLSLWNADGGLIGGGAPCFYSYFGLDSVINQISGHDLDAERTVMLLAAPEPSGFVGSPSDYKIFSIYTAAHEGTFFDQSEYLYPQTPVAPGYHFNVAQSLSKHSSYSFNPDYYPITPAAVIFNTNEFISDAYAAGELSDGAYLAAIAAADDTFYGCLVERFGDQGGVPPSSTLNVGEVAHPLGGGSFIKDDSARALMLADKLTDNTF